MKPERAYRQLRELMAKRDAALLPVGASRDTPEFVAFMRAEREVGDFLARHDHELAALREPIAGTTTGRYRERLARPDTELGWLEERAAEAGHTGSVYPVRKRPRRSCWLAACG